MLYRIIKATRIITEDDNNFSVDGFMNPIFYNEGDTTVRINNLPVLAGEKYADYNPGCVMQGTINIDFDTAAGQADKVIIHYSKVVGQYMAQDGSIVPDTQRAIAAYTPGCN